MKNEKYKNKDMILVFTNLNQILLLQNPLQTTRNKKKKLFFVKIFHQKNSQNNNFKIKIWIIHYKNW